MGATLDIVIVNWNSGRQLAGCLRSVAAASQSGVRPQRVVVVDNASSDDSLDLLEPGDLPLEICRNPTNRGFGAACNQGAAGSSADYLLFLNPDTVLGPAALSVPVEFMEAAGNERVGIAGIQLQDSQGRISRSCARFPSAATFVSDLLGLNYLFPRRFPACRRLEWDHLDSREVDHVTGAFFVIRRTVFEELGGFDERFFMYLEDLDLSLRARQAGWSTWYLTGASAFHRQGGTSEQVKAARLSYNLASRIRYCGKHLGRGKATGVFLGTVLVEPVLRLAYALVRGAGREFAQTLGGYVMLWKEMPALARETLGGRRGGAAGDR